jgi:hypothetical protein
MSRVLVLLRGSARKLGVGREVINFDFRSLIGLTGG